MGNRNSSSRKQSTAGRLRRRKLQQEMLETRQLLAVGPTLIGVGPNNQQLLELDANDPATVLRTAPTEMRLTFDGGYQLDRATLPGGTNPNSVFVEFTEKSTLNAFSNTIGDFRASNPLVRTVNIGYIEAEDPSQVTLRFSEPLKDGFYRIVVTSDLETTNNLPFQPAIPDASVQEIFFEVELGASVVAVVPQPTGVSQVAGNVIVTPNNNWINVYFDDADLFENNLPSNPINNPNFYQLINTRGTAEYSDDVSLGVPVDVVTPSERGETATGADLPADRRWVQLRFNQPLDVLAGGAATLRLRIGDTQDPLSVLPIVVNPATDPGGSLLDPTGPFNLHAAGARWSRIVNESISGVGLSIDYPGAGDEPGHREVDEQDHFINPSPVPPPTSDGDSTPGITQYKYNFAKTRSYGFDSANAELNNNMTSDQEARLREVLEIYGATFGIDFIETDREGTTIVVGDMWPADEVSSRGDGNLGIYNPTPPPSRIPGSVNDLLILDGNENWYNGFGKSPDARPSLFEAALTEMGRMLGLGTTADLPAGGYMGFEPRIGANGVEWVFPGMNDVVHGQHLYKPEALDVDLYQFTIPAGGGKLSAEVVARRLETASALDPRMALFKTQADGSLTLVAVNDDYFGADSFLSVALEGGTYFVGVSAEGNRFDPNSASLGSGGTSEGGYQLRLDFESTDPTLISALRDTDGSALDGNRDGIAGGTHNFWFNVTPGAVNPNTGALPSTPATIYVHKGNSVAGNGSAFSPFRNLNTALAAARPGDIVRVLGDRGNDNNPTTLGDNRPYAVGQLNNVNLTDGRNVEVPAGVTMMIEPGAIFKMLDSRILVGSDQSGQNRSNGAIQVLGVPGMPVHFTSFNDRTIGSVSNPNATPAAPGNWGGIEIRADVDRAQGRVDREREGIFINYVNNSVLNYGGGTVTNVGPIAPIHLAAQRPEISYNAILNSAGAAVSADPNSFEYTTFTEHRYQANGAFAPDYQRIGPDLYRNTLANNSINGAFVRIDTLAGNRLQPLEVPARFNDTDIVHVMNESLLVEGSPGGNFIESHFTRPANDSIVFQTTTGTLAVGNYWYSYTYVDAFGNETLPSLPVQGALSVVGGLVVNSIPAVPANSEYASRRLYRSASNDPATFRLLAELDRSSSAFIDRGDRTPRPKGFSVSTGVATAFLPTAENIRGRRDASLVIDPGAIIKSQGSRIELGVGTTVIAEGTFDKKIVFTSRSDDRYGAGGTFDTNKDGIANPVSDGTPGEWGGIYAGRLSRLSLDHTVVANGGGIVGVEGTLAGFGVVEIHEADARIANSRFENNADGQGGQSTPVREGRGPNSAATIYAVNSQPIIVDNVFEGNGWTRAGSVVPVANLNQEVISINADSLNAKIRSDSGRQTGAVDLHVDSPGNRGPLISGNAIGQNGINGLAIRPQTLTTESVWDDTDITHVLRGEISIPDFHTSGGLRLQSAADEALVVKLQGADAGFTATGRPLDITDRIGGRLHVLGTPGFPVVLTSLSDCTVGAGFTPDGRAATNTINDQFCGTTIVNPTAPPYADIIVVMDETITMTGTQVFSGQLIQDLDAALLAAGIGSTAAGGNRYGAVGFGSNSAGPLGRSVPIGPGGALFGTAVEYATATSLFRNDGATEEGYSAINFAISNYQVRPDAAKFIILASDEDRDVVSTNLTFASTLADLQANGFAFQAIVDLTVRDGANGLALAVDAVNNIYTQTGSTFTVSTGGTVTGSGTTVTDYVDLVRATGGIAGDIGQIAVSAQTQAVFSQVLVSSIVGQVTGGGTDAAAGDWAGITLDQFSSDRNVETEIEYEGDISGFGDKNGEPGTAQYLGRLATGEKASDENLRLGFTIHGTIADTSDVDVYRFEGTAGTLAWIDIDHTDYGLDAVVELIDDQGNTLVLSDNSHDETNAQALTFADPSMPAGHALPMKKDTQAPMNFDGSYRDQGSTNLRDPGFRVVLPGSAGRVGEFFIRVRSNNRAPGQLPSVLYTNPIDGTSKNPLSPLPATGYNGRSKGNYQLQVRLRETDEFGGSTVRYADIRFATNGIQIIGLPGHSPLAGENRNIVGSAGVTNLGNIGNTDRGAISAGGILTGPGDFDRYALSVVRDSTIDGTTSLAATSQASGTHISTTIDVDFADGLARANTSVFLYNGTRLVAIGTDSNIADDRVTPRIPADNTDLSRGSLGPKDPFIGPIELNAGDNYEVIVATNGRIPAELLQFTNLNAPNRLARLEPLDGMNRIADDRFNAANAGQQMPLPDPNLPGTSQSPFDPTAPRQVVIGSDAATGRVDNVVPWHLGDVPLLVMRESGSGSLLSMYNPFTGRHDAILSNGTSQSSGAFPNNQTFIGAFAGNPGQRSADGTLMIATQRGPIGGRNDGNTDAVYNISTDGVITTRANTTGINTNSYQLAGTTHQSQVANVGMEFESLAYWNSPSSGTRFLYGLAHRAGNPNATFTGLSTAPGPNNTVVGNGFVPGVSAGNLIYLMNPDTGAAIGRRGNTLPANFAAADPFEYYNNTAGGGDNLPNLLTTDANGLPVSANAWAGTNVVAQLQIPTTGTVTGLVTRGSNLLAFVDNGEIWSMAISVSGGGQFAAGDLFAPVLIVNPTTNPIVVVDPVTATATPLVMQQVTNGPTNYNDPSGNNANSLMYGVAQTSPGVYRMYAFPVPTAGASVEAVPVFNGANGSVALDNTQTGGNINGLYFSPLASNLWHLSNTEASTPGHGFEPLDGDTRDAGNSIQGGGTLFFGFAPPSSPSANQTQGFSGYNFPGGAYGVVEGNPISLAGVSADDLPMLYFTYRLSTDNTNTSLVGSGSNPMRDSFRVYAAGDDNVWRLVATNNFDGTSPAGRDYSSGIQEYGESVSGFSDRATQTFVQELFDDGANFRQARIDLGAFAGNENVRLRFEFATGGEMRPDQSEIRAAPGHRIPDGYTFTVDGQTFEFDHGLLLAMPSGRAITDGATLSRDANPILRLIKSGVAGPTDVLIADTDSPEEVATKVRTALTNILGLPAANSAANPSWVNIPGALAGAYTFTNDLPVSMIRGQPSPLAVNRVAIDIGMPGEQVRDLMRTAMAQVFNAPGRQTNLDSFPVVGNAGEAALGIRLYDRTVTQSGNVLTVVSNATMPASNFGVYQDRSFTGLVRAGRTTVGSGTGVHLDDLVIGLAERGETVSGTSSGAFPADPPVNPFFRPNFNGQVSEIADGPYQMEIRTSREMLLEQESTTGAGFYKWLNAYHNPNDRLARGINMTVESSGSEITDGDTFQLSNGVETLTFEFNDSSVASNGVTFGNISVPFQSHFSRGQVADSIRAAINADGARDILKIEAASRGGQLSDPTDPVIVLHGPAAGDVHGGIVFEPSVAPLERHLSGQLTGTNDLWGEDNGDVNRFRDQGQVIVQATTIRDSLNYGIVATAAPAGPTTQAPLEGTRPRPGAVANLPTLNADQQVPGVVLMNNLLIENGSGGIQLVGDTTGAAPDTFARVINNTIYGGTDGILIQNGAAPTLLNNAIVDTGVGIRATGAGTIVVAGTLFQDNNTNTSAGVPSDPFAIFATNQVFREVGARNFYPFVDLSNPALSSQLIDSSIVSREERQNLQFVKNAVGIAFSPVLAPARDLVGRSRPDDINVNPSFAGQGSNVFLDRGAIDSSDNQGPIAQLLLPLDNDRAGLDIGEVRGGSDRLLTTVYRATAGSSILNYFALQLLEPTGIGPDARTVTAERVLVTENGRRLTPGAEYTFGYNASSRQIRLTPAAGLWRPDAVYEITLLNDDYTMVQPPAPAGIDAGQPLFGNELTDEQQFTVTGDVPVTFEFDSGYVFRVGQPLTINVSAGVEAGGIQFGDTFVVTTPTGSLDPAITFEFVDSLGVGTVPAPRVPVIVELGFTAEQVRDAIQAALLGQATLGLNPVVVPGGIQLGAAAGQTVSFTAPSLSQTGGGGVSDGQTFSYTRAGGSAGLTVTFQINVTDGPTPTLLPPVTGTQPHVEVPILTTSTPDQIAAAIATAMRNHGSVADDSNLRLSHAQAIPGGIVYLGGAAGDVLSLGTMVSNATILSRPGVQGAMQLTLPSTVTAAGLDTQRVTITYQGTPYTFEFSLDASVPPNINRVLILPGDNAGQIATKLATAIRTTVGLGLPGAAPGATNDESDASKPGTVVLNESFGSYSIATGTSGLISSGIAGGAVAIPFIPSASFTQEAVAAGILGAITNVKALGVEGFGVGGGTLYLRSTTSGNPVPTVTGLANRPISSIRDLAGNKLQNNRIADQTRFTIMLGGEHALDFGDASSRDGLNSSPQTTVGFDANGNQIDGARHVILSGLNARSPILGSIAPNGAAIVNPALTLIDGELNGQPTVGATGDLGDETGLVLPGSLADLDAQARLLSRMVFNADYNRSTPAQVDIVATDYGLVSAWIDWNLDGDFSDAHEQVVNNIPVWQGINTLSIVVPDVATIGFDVMNPANTPATPAPERTLRLRISQTGSVRPDQIVVGGEVEDHEITLSGGTAPVANDDQFTWNEDTLQFGTTGLYQGNLITNDLDLDGDDIKILDIVNPLTGQSHIVRLGVDGSIVDLRDESGEIAGTLTVRFDGSFDFQTAPHYNTDNFPVDPANPGSDRRLFFTYRSVDQSGVPSLNSDGTGQPASVFFNVRPVNDAPIPGLDTGIELLEDFDGEPVIDPTVAGFIGTQVTLTNTLTSPATGNLPVVVAGPTARPVANNFADPEFVSFASTFNIDVDGNSIRFELNQTGGNDRRGIIGPNTRDIYTFVFDLPPNETITGFTRDATANSQPLVRIVSGNTIEVEFASGMTIADGYQAGITVQTSVTSMTLPLVFGTQTFQVTVRENLNNPAGFSKRELILPAAALLVNDSAGPANEIQQSLHVIGVDTLNGTPGVQTELTVEYIKDFDFGYDFDGNGNTIGDAIRIVPQEHGVGLARFQYTLWDNGDGGLPGSNVTYRGGNNQAFGTVELLFRAVNDAPVPDAAGHADRNYTTPEESTRTISGIEIVGPSAGVIDEAGPRRDSLHPIDETTGQSVRISHVNGRSANNGVVTFDELTNTITYTPALNYDSYDDDGNITPDIITYIIADFDPNLPSGANAPTNFVRDLTTGQLVNRPVSRQSDSSLHLGTIFVTVVPVNDPPSVGVDPVIVESLEDVTTTFSNFLNAYAAASAGPNETDALRLDPDPSTVAMEPEHTAPVQLPTAQGGFVTIGLRKANGDYDLTYQPPADFFGTDTVTLALIDIPPVLPAGLVPQRVPFTLEFTVRPVNDAPGGISDLLHLLEDTVTSIDQSLLFTPSTLLGSLTDDQPDQFYAGGPQASATATRETSNAAGNVPQSASQFQLTGAFTLISGFSDNDPTTTGGDARVELVGGQVQITPPRDIYTRDALGNQVHEPLVFTYEFLDSGTTFVDDGNPATPLVATTTNRIGIGTVTVNIYPVNDAPLGRQHLVNNVLEDVPFTMNPSDFFLELSDLVAGMAPPNTKDSAGALENVGPDNLYTPVGTPPALDTVVPTQVLSFVGIDATGNLSFTTSLGGTVTLDLTANGGRGAITYRSPLNFFSADALDVDTFTYRMRDNGATYSFTGVAVPHLTPPTLPVDPASDDLEGTGTVIVQVQPVNDPPEIANPVTLEAREDQSVTYPGFLYSFAGARPGPANVGTTPVRPANETEPLRLDPDPSTLAIEAEPIAPVTLVTSAGGTVVISVRNLAGDYDLTYNPPLNFFGIDTVEMAVVDVPPGSLTPIRVPFTVQFTVRPENDTPVGTTDLIHVLEDTVARFDPSLLLNNDQVDGFFPGGPSVSLRAVRETLNDFGNVPQSSAQFSLTANFTLVSGFADNDPTTTTGDAQVALVGGLVEITPPRDIYTKDRSGNDVHPPLVFTYEFIDQGTTFVDHDGDPATPLQPTTTQQVGIGTVTVHIWPVNDAPIGRTHTFTSVVEDVAFPIGPNDLFVTLGNLTNGSGPLASRDSAGPLEDVGPDNIYTASGPSPTVDTVAPTQQLRLVGLAAVGTTQFTTARGGTVTLDPAANNGLGGIVYVSAPNFFSQNPTDTDSFTYRMRDNGVSYTFAGVTTPFLNPPVLPANPTVDELGGVGTVVLQVQPVNDPPVATNPNFQSLEDQDQAIVDVLNFAQVRSGPNGEPLDPALGFTLVLQPQAGLPSLNGGTVTLSAKKPNGDYDLTYRGPADFFGLDEIVLTVTDSHTGGLNPLSVTFTLTATVRPVNDAPEATDDTVHMLEDTVGFINPFDLTPNDHYDPFRLASFPTVSEDSNAAGNPPQRNQDLRVTAVRLLSGPTGMNNTHVSLVDGRVRVTPPANYYNVVSGTVRADAPILLEYTVTDVGSSFTIDSSGQFVLTQDPKSSVGTVSVNVWPVNDAPVTKPHLLENLLEDQTRPIFAEELILRGNDLVNGMAPPAAKDSAGPFEDAGPDNIFQAPAEVGIYQSVRIIGLGSVTSPQTTFATLRGGTVVLIDSDNNLANGYERINYTPPANFVSSNGLLDEFTYVISDNGVTYSLAGGTASLNPPNSQLNELSQVGTVTLSINPVNDKPQFFIGSDLGLDEDHNQTTSSTHRAPNSITVLSPGEIEISNFAVGIRGGPATAEDESGQSVSFSLSVFSGNAGVLATNGGVPDISLSSTGTLRVRLAPNASGEVVINVVGTDDFTSNPASYPNIAGGDDPVRFTITVGAVNDPPEFSLEPAIATNGNTIVVPEDSGLRSVQVVTAGSVAAGPATALNVSLGGGEVEQTVTLHAALVEPVLHGPLFTVAPHINDEGVLQFTAAPNAFTTTPIAVRVFATDNGLSQLPNRNRSYTTANDPFPGTNPNYLERTLFLSITASNDPPVAVDDPVVPNSLTTNERAALNLTGLLTNDFDGDSTNPLVLNGLNGGGMTGTSAQGAVLTAQPNGTVLYNPVGVNVFRSLSQGDQLVDTFTYTVTDGQLTSNIATVTVIVTGINDAPVAGADNFRIGVNRVTDLEVAANDSDLDGRIDLQSILIKTLPTRGSIEVLPDGKIRYTPNANFVGVDQFSYSIADAVGLESAPATVLVNVEPIPATVDDRVNTVRNQSVTIRPLTNDATGLDPASLTIVSGPANGLIDVANGIITYTPRNNFTGTDNIIYTVRSAGANGVVSDPTRITIVVTGSAGQSGFDPIDVNASGESEPLDALLVINHLNSSKSFDVEALDAQGFFDPTKGPFLDVNGNAFIEPLDALLVINYLNKQSGFGEAEPSPSAFVAPPIDVSLSVAVDRTVPSATDLLDFAISSAMMSGPADASSDERDLSAYLIDLTEDDADAEESEELIDQFWTQFGDL